MRRQDELSNMLKNLLDLSREEPMVAGERISVLDIHDVVTAEDGNINRVCEMWNLSEAQVKAALEYYEKHEEEMEAIRARNEAHLDDILEAQTVDV